MSEKPRVLSVIDNSSMAVSINIFIIRLRCDAVSVVGNDFSSIIHLDSIL
jgi:hypothetical protein